MLYNFKYFRKKVGGIWIKTKHRGWICGETYMFYIGYKFDPILIKVEDYGKMQ
jgi:hypothetical protein